MKICIFDTETTGLPATSEISYEKLSLWPYIVQISYIIYETDTCELIKVRDHIIKLPDNMKINEESIKIHGITDEISQKKGVYLDEIMEEFIDDFQGVECMVAHNINFDLNILKIEVMRQILKMNISYSRMITTRSILKRKILNNRFLIALLNNDKQKYCTMRESIQLCNIIKINKLGHNYLKFPKLIELHQILFQVEPRNLHNSLNDILICLRCFCKLKYNYDILDKNMKIKKMIELLL